MVFELMSTNLYSYLKQNNLEPSPKHFYQRIGI